MRMICLYAHYQTCVFVLVCVKEIEKERERERERDRVCMSLYASVCAFVFNCSDVLKFTDRSRNSQENIWIHVWFRMFDAVCCSVLQCVAVCSSELHLVTYETCHVAFPGGNVCVAVCCNVSHICVLQCFAVFCSVSQCVAQCVTVCCSVLHCVVAFTYVCLQV